MVSAITLDRFGGFAIALTVFLTCGTCGTDAADEAVTDLPTIQRHWTEWRQSFATIRVVGREWDQASVFQYYPEVDQKKDEWRETFVVRGTFTWSDTGGFKYATDLHKHGKLYHRSWQGVGGQRPWTSSSFYADDKNGGDTDRWKQILIFRPESERPLATNYVIPFIYGLWNSSGLWFDEFLMDKTPPTIVGVEPLDGVSCVVLKKNVGGQAERVYWLDSSHSYLPKKVTATETREGGIVEHFTWEISDFQQVDGRFWFPKKIKHVIPDPTLLPGFECTIDEVVLNEPLPQSSFGPPMPSPETKITDYQTMTAHSAPGGPVNSEEQPPKSALNPSPLQATAPNQSWIWWGIICGVLLMVVAAAISRYNATA